MKLNCLLWKPLKHSACGAARYFHKLRLGSHSMKPAIFFCLCVALAASFVSACAHNSSVHAAPVGEVMTNEAAAVVAVAEAPTNEAPAVIAWTNEVPTPASNESAAVVAPVVASTDEVSTASVALTNEAMAIVAPAAEISTNESPAVEAATDKVSVVTVQTAE